LDNKVFNTLNAELNPVYHLLALLGAHPILHISRVRVKVQMKRFPLIFNLNSGKMKYCFFQSDCATDHTASNSMTALRIIVVLYCLFCQPIWHHGTMFSFIARQP